MKKCFEETNYLVCPHTAIGMMYHYKNNQTTKRWVNMINFYPLQLDFINQNVRSYISGNTKISWYSIPRVIVATASPAKFPDAVEKAIGKTEYSTNQAGTDPTASKINHLFNLPTKFDSQMKSGADWTKILKSKIEEISNNITTS